MDALVRNATAISDIVVELSGVCKTFRQKQRSERLRDAVRTMLRPPIREVRALQQIDLQIRRGEIVAYAGPNGAGKSTTVTLLSGMLAPDAGAVRSLGMDHPIAASFEWKRVVWDIPRPRYERMRDLVKELLGLGEFFNSLTRELSLGQKMRAELGLALLHEPELLFLDEPTIGLDVLAKRTILGFIKDLNRDRRVTVMLTSHDMAELEQLAGRIVMIDHGKIAFDGSFERLRREVSDQRRLLLETANGAPPALGGAKLVKSEAGRHEYTFDATQTKIAMLLEQAASQMQVLDVETHRAPIDEVIADIYRQWQR